MTSIISGKTMGAAATAGALIAGAFFAISPTSAQDSCEEVKYYAKVSSKTKLTIRSVAKPGQGNEAKVKVTAASTAPTGTVTMTIDGAFFADAALDSKGRTAFGLPASLKAGQTHTVTVRYPGDCRVNGSDDTKFQTISPAASQGPGTGPANVLGTPRSPIRIDAGD